MSDPRDKLHELVDLAIDLGDEAVEKLGVSAILKLNGLVTPEIKASLRGLAALVHFVEGLAAPPDNVVDMPSEKPK